jgi:hypothetical protein
MDGGYSTVTFIWKRFVEHMQAPELIQEKTPRSMEADIYAFGMVRNHAYTPIPEDMHYLILLIISTLLQTVVASHFAILVSILNMNIMCRRS